MLNFTMIAKYLFKVINKIIRGRLKDTVPRSFLLTLNIYFPTILVSVSFIDYCFYSNVLYTLLSGQEANTCIEVINSFHVVTFNVSFL